MLGVLVRHSGCHVFLHEVVQVKEIVAIVTKDQKIMNHPESVINAIRAHNVEEFLDRRAMQFMASFDLGSRWETLAQSPTLFVLDGDEVKSALLKITPKGGQQ